jgi:hypothetical protein
MELVTRGSAVCTAAFRKAVPYTGSLIYFKKFLRKEKNLNLEKHESDAAG